MLIALALAALLGLFFFLRHRKHTKVAAPAEGTLPPALEEWVAEALSTELRGVGLGVESGNRDNRDKLRATLKGEPEPEIVGAIADAVRRVELEYTRLPHEADAELALVVRFEDGREGRRARRVPLAELPADVHAELTSKAVTRVFRAWSFSWDR
ncbi:MAG: hypothetical protein IPF92_14960 [Myxococcales bacterium]|jgi:hypothetical protein|nr:hypothetical protein [Myxococcales bacterium]MBL0195176.1 hypothetical protein [Myxococcales bacterium]